MPRATEGSVQVVFRSLVHSPVPQALREPPQTNSRGDWGEKVVLQPKPTSSHLPPSLPAKTFLMSDFMQDVQLDLKQKENQVPHPQCSGHPNAAEGPRSFVSEQSYKQEEKIHLPMCFSSRKHCQGSPSQGSPIPASGTSLLCHVRLS